MHGTRCRLHKDEDCIADGTALRQSTPGSSGAAHHELDAEQAEADEAAQQQQLGDAGAVAAGAVAVRWGAGAQRQLGAEQPAAPAAGACLLSWIAHVPSQRGRSAHHPLRQAKRWVLPMSPLHAGLCGVCCSAPVAALAGL